MEIGLSAWMVVAVPVLLDSMETIAVSGARFVPLGSATQARKGPAFATATLASTVTTAKQRALDLQEILATATVLATNGLVRVLASTTQRMDTGSCHRAVAVSEVGTRTIATLLAPSQTT